MMCFMMYASAPAGTEANISPPAIVQRSITGFSGPSFAPATHVHDGSHFTERIGIGHGWTVNRGQIGHALMEELPFLGMLLEELKNGHAINLIESLLSSAYAIIEMGPAESVPISAVHHRECSQTWIRVSPKDRGKRCFGKLSIGPFRKHSHTSCRAHQ